MHQLVATWCSDVNGLLLPSEKGKRGKFASGGLKGPDLRAPAALCGLPPRVGGGDPFLREARITLLTPGSWETGVTSDQPFA